MPYLSLSGIRKWPGPLILIGFLALLIRLIYLLELRGTPLLAVVIGDASQPGDWLRLMGRKFLLVFSVS